MGNEDLYNRIEQLEKELKKAKRQIRQYETLIERNRISTAAKDNLGRIIEKERSRLETYMNLLLQNSPDIIILFDNNNHILFCTDSFLKIAEIPSFGMIYNKTFVDVLKSLGLDDFIDFTKALSKDIQNEMKTQVAEAEIDFSGKGDTRKYKIQVTPMVDEDGHHLGSMAFFIDTTDILIAKDEAEKANNAKSDFLATVSHEIRTPMNAIIGIANMMESTRLDETQLGYMSGIKRSSNVLLNLINDILDFAKIESGKLEILPDYFQLKSLLSYIKSMFGLMFNDKPIEFTCEFDDDLPSVIYGDEKRVDQIMTNILNNAYKYTESGSVKFRVYKGSGNKVVFEINDTGIGIKQDALPRLFSEFEQLDLVKNKKIAGTGLGLAITKYLIDEMGGTIDVSSVYGEGSVFTVAIPFKTGTKKDLPQKEISVSNFNASTADILVVDDIDINLEIAQYMLKEFNIEADIAISGKKALKLYEKKKYDIVLMDHMMPEMDGVETAHRMRAMDGASVRTPIVALTANAVSSAVEMFKEEGFDGFLPKPMNRNSLAVELLKFLPKEKVHIED